MFVLFLFLTFFFSNGATPLHYAVKTGKLEFVTELINFGADPNITNSVYVFLLFVFIFFLFFNCSCSGETPLHVALVHGHDSIIAHLSKGSDTNSDMESVYRRWFSDFRLSAPEISINDLRYEQILLQCEPEMNDLIDEPNLELEYYEPIVLCEPNRDDQTLGHQSELEEDIPPVIPPSQTQTVEWSASKPRKSSALRFSCGNNRIPCTETTKI